MTGKPVRADCGCPTDAPTDAQPVMSRRRLLGLATAAAVGAYLGVPAFLQWDHAGKLRANSHDIRQVDTEPPVVDAALVKRLANTTTSRQAAPIIITYHDISHTKSQYSVTPENFAAQMRLLHDAGWTTLTTADLEAWCQGEPLPPRSVLITFDDGCMGVWRYAEPVMRRYNMRATAFIITGFVGTHAPYYMTWQQVNDLHTSGRWDLQSHTHVGHVYVPADANGGTGPFLTTAQYLPDKRRVETTAEYHDRVYSDLAECKRQLAMRGYGEPRFFAYPYSAHEAEVAHDSVLSLYHSGLLDDAHLIQVTASEDMASGLLRRMDITWNVSPDDFVRKLELASPLDPANAPLRNRELWTSSDQQPPNQLTIDGNRMVIDPGPSAATTVHFSRLRTTMWENYAFSADLVVPDQGTTTGLCAYVGNLAHEVVVSIDRGYYSISFANTDIDLSAGDLPDADVYHVDVTVSPTQVSCAINGQQMPPVAIGPPAGPRHIAGGIGIISRRTTDTSPVSTVDNLVIR
jgi:hypothetical protein